MSIGWSGRRLGAVGLEPLELPLLLSNEASELVVCEAGGGRLSVILNAAQCINVRIYDGVMRAFIGKRIGMIVGGVPTMWVPLKIWSKITMWAIVSIVRTAGGGKGLLDGILLMSPGKVVFRGLCVGGMLKSVGKARVLSSKGG